MENAPTPIQRACKALGSASALAAAIGKSPQFVSQLVSGHKQVPAELCPLIEKATRERPGAEVVTCEELRPDVHWSVLREQAA